MNKMKKVTIISIVLFFILIALLVGIKSNIQNVHVAKGASESKMDFTQLTPEEQAKVDNQLEGDWETPHSSQFVELQDGATTITGNKWYYLTQDITVNISTNVTEAVRILFNGYSISGTFQVRAEQYTERNKVLLFDKIPDMTGTGYMYNPTPERYFSYNSSTQGYTNYSNTKPAGTDVTDMPTWQQNTYIKVTGSAIAPNSRNSSCTTFLYAYAYATLNMYSINVVGTIAKNNSIIVANGYAKVNLYQCNVLGNKSNGSTWGASVWSNVAAYQDSKMFLKGCKIYGNQITRNNFGIEISNHDMPKKLADISIGHNSYLTFEKSNIGAIWDHSKSYSAHKKAVWLKDVDFKQTIHELNMEDNNKASKHNFENIIQNMDNITGTIELVYNINLTYNGNSPNLKFVVYGGDSNVAPRKGFNHLAMGKGATVGNITTAFSDSTISDITVNGTASQLSTLGNVTIGESGIVTIESGQSVGGRITNNGILNIFGAVNQLITSNGTTSILGNANITQIDMLGGETQLKTATATLPSDLLVQKGAIFTIFEDTYTPANVTNHGKVNVNGTIAQMQNEATGIISVNSNGKIENITSKGEIKVNSGGNIENLTVEDGYTFIHNSANVKNAVLNKGTLEIARKANVDSVVQSNGTLIDHRVQSKRVIVIISSVIGGVILLCIIFILVMVIIRKKAKVANHSDTKK